MNPFTVIVIAVGLAMDAFAVSIVCGSAYKRFRLKHALRIAVFFGLFQAFMPLVGALAGMTMRQYVADYDHWIAFALLSAVAAKMIYESFKIRPAEERFDPSNVFVLMALSVATSIDALAIGVTLSLLAARIATAVIIIGAVTFALSYLGVWIGGKFGHFFESKIQALGGMVLLGLATKILIEHTFA